MPLLKKLNHKPHHFISIKRVWFLIKGYTKGKRDKSRDEHVLVSPTVAKYLLKLEKNDKRKRTKTR